MNCLLVVYPMGPEKFNLKRGNNWDVLVVSVFHLHFMNISFYSKYPYHGKCCKQAYEQRDQQVKHARGRFFTVEFIQVEDSP